MIPFLKLVVSESLFVEQATSSIIGTRHHVKAKQDRQQKVVASLDSHAIDMCQFEDL